MDKFQSHIVSKLKSVVSYNKKIDTNINIDHDLDVILNGVYNTVRTIKEPKVRMMTLLNLIENKDELLSANNNPSTNLFSLEDQKITTNVFLVPEMKKVDYFLKIENALLPLTEIVSQINTISQVSTAYCLDPENLKSKNNLIF